MFHKTPSSIWWYYLWSGLQLIFTLKIRIDSIRCCFSLNWAIKGSSRENLYQELCLESLRLLRWYRKLCFYKMHNKQDLGYLTKLTYTRNEAYQIRHVANILSLGFKNDLFKNTFFPSAILEWNKLDPSFWNSASYNLPLTTFSNVITQKKRNQISNKIKIWSMSSSSA